MVAAGLHESKHTPKVKFANHIESVPGKSAACLFRVLSRVIHLQPSTKVERLAAVLVLPQLLEEHFRALVNIFLRFEHVAQGVHVVHDAPPLSMDLVIRACKHVRVFAEVLIVPDRVEVGLVQGFLVPIDGLDGIRVSTCDLIGCDSDEWPILGMQTSLRVFHVSSGDLEHVPRTAHGCQPWSRYLVKGMEMPGVDNPKDPVSDQCP